MEKLSKVNQDTLYPQCPPQSQTPIDNLWNTIETDSDTLFSLSQHVLQDLYYFIIGTLGGIREKLLRITEWNKWQRKKHTWLRPTLNLDNHDIWTLVGM